MDILKQSSKIWVTELTANLSTFWDTIDADVAKDGKASYLIPLQKSFFKFFTKCLVGADASNSPKIAESGYAMLDRWLALQLLPTVKIGVLQPLEEIFLHSFAYPSFLVSGDYKKLYQFIEEYGKLKFKHTITHSLQVLLETINTCIYDILLRLLEMCSTK